MTINTTLIDGDAEVVLSDKGGMALFVDGERVEFDVRNDTHESASEYYYLRHGEKQLQTTDFNEVCEALERWMSL